MKHFSFNYKNSHNKLIYIKLGSIFLFASRNKALQSIFFLQEMRKQHSGKNLNA